MHGFRSAVLRPLKGSAGSKSIASLFDFMRMATIIRYAPNVDQTIHIMFDGSPNDIRWRESRLHDAFAGGPPGWGANNASRYLCVSCTCMGMWCYVKLVFSLSVNVP
jgi:hypothetical protein